MLSGSFVTLHRQLPKPQAGLRLNQALMNAVAEGAPYRYLLATRTGAVIGASEPDMMMAAFTARADGKINADTLASKVTERLVTLGRGILKAGNRLTARDEIFAEVRDIAEKFSTETITTWKALGIV